MKALHGVTLLLVLILKQNAFSSLTARIALGAGLQECVRSSAQVWNMA